MVIDGVLVGLGGLGRKYFFWDGSNKLALPWFIMNFNLLIISANFPLDFPMKGNNIELAWEF